MSDPQRTAVISRFSLAPHTSTRLTPCWSIVQVLLGTIQLGISSGGISSISTVATTSCRNCSFSLVKLVLVRLLLAVVTFLCTNFIWCSNEYARCLLSSTCPPNSTSSDLSQVRTMPLAAAIAILADMTPPPSLTFFKYICTFISKSSPKSTRHPRLLAGRTARSPSSTSALALFSFSLWRECLTYWRCDLAFSKSTRLLLSRHGDIHMSLYRLGQLGYTYIKEGRECYLLLVSLPATSKLMFQWYLPLDKCIGHVSCCSLGNLHNFATGQGNGLWR